MKNERINMNAELQQDELYVKSKIVNLEKITGIPTRRGLEQAVISEGQIVNVVSKGYGHLPNEKFFLEVERKLVNSNINYISRTINRENRSFAADYILSDPDMVVTVKNNKDKIVPMLRFVNSYDGSCRTSGHFGFFREICQNGLHVATSEIGFAMKHRGDITEVVLPEIKSLIKKFYDNEYYTLRHKFEVLAEKPIKDINKFVKMTADKMKIFQYEISEKNPDPSLNARMVIDIIKQESSLLGEKPNMWIGYNAFNSVLHNKLKRTFESQKQLDGKLIEVISQF